MAEFLPKMKLAFIAGITIFSLNLKLHATEGQLPFFPFDGKWMGSGATQYSDGVHVSYFEFFSIQSGKVRGRQINQDKETEYIKWDFELQPDRTLKTVDGLSGSCIDFICNFELNSDAWRMQTVWSFSGEELVRTEVGSFGKLSYRQISKLKKQK